MTPVSLLPSSITKTLSQSPIPALRKLAAEEADGVVVLTGSVRSYYLKQLAQETVMPLLGGRELVNRVTVVRQPGPGHPGYTA